MSYYFETDQQKKVQLKYCIAGVHTNLFKNDRVIILNKKSCIELIEGNYQIILSIQILKLRLWLIKRKDPRLFLFRVRLVFVRDREIEGRGRDRET